VVIKLKMTLMKFYIKLFVLLFLVATACDDDETKVNDPIHEFVAFKGTPSVAVNEKSNSEEAFPLVIELRAFKPYPEDIEVTLDITGTNAEEGVDFTVTPGQSVIIPAGSFVSEPILIHTIDNESGTTLARSFTIAINSLSKDINIGLGLTEARNSSITVNILDDECSESISIYNSDQLVNTLDWGGGPVIKPVKGSVDNNTVEVTGDLIDYGPFSNAAITITLTPEIEGGTKGTATFGEQVAGTDDDGYEYKFIQVGDGTFDVCSGTISVEYDIYYMDGDWVYWYSVENVIAVP
jgi:hypothetical protein